MWNLARVAWNLRQSRRLSFAIPPSISATQIDPSFFKRGLPFTTCKGFSTLETQESGGLIPSELLTKKTVLRPDRDIGQYADLVTRVTNFHGEDKGFMVLAGDVFDVPIRKDIIHRVVRWQLAKRQQGTHSTKTISEVSGTGRKPYRQKGTGRARHGTLRGPQFRHGAIMHGPKPRSHAIKLQKKVRRLGLKIALSARTAEGKLIVFEDLALPSHKTKNIVNYVTQMENTKKVLLVDGGPIDDKLKLATRNLHYVNVLPSIGLNVYSILLHDVLVMTQDAVNRIVERMHTPINR
ncbi:unnamed protein product [Musa acuminata subsp. malaccensis]|uniref:Large ribosomal subunit protein uL4m n=1 Tax=Musa acuminata subsp. malaccensis TaxID=214687 RepID=A0A804JY16_MUSAM|nr:PREDICTED: uncharacterized protein LOC103992291 [Musa acuminata subsp. malaccensis]CAG1857292.1 unnamed protein product [Musa acuminata subsp. malaccensis]